MVTRRLLTSALALLLAILLPVSASACVFAPVCYDLHSVRTGNTVRTRHTPAKPPLRPLWETGSRPTEPDFSEVTGVQLIIVDSVGNAAVLRLYEKVNGVWTAVSEPMDGRLGKNGVTTDKREGDGCTPAGLYSLTEAFGVQPLPSSGLPYRQAGPDSYWVDDPDSQFYNTWGEGRENADWQSAEHLTDYPALYAYAAVIDYNRDPVVPGKGSAIFLHCGANPTAGCVSTAEENIIRILEWLDPTASPQILIR